jgi:hypothetical protein
MQSQKISPKVSGVPTLQGLNALPKHIDSFRSERLENPGINTCLVVSKISFRLFIALICGSEFLFRNSSLELAILTFNAECLKEF